MAVLLVDSFDWMDNNLTGVQADVALGRKVPSHDILAFTDGDTGPGIGGKGTAIGFAEATSQFVRWGLASVAAATDEIGIGIWFKATGTSGSWGTAGGALFGVFDSAGSIYHINVRISLEGFVQVYRSTSLITTTDISLTKNEWNWLAMKTVVNNSTGSYTVQLNGTTIATASGVDTNAGGNGDVGFIQLSCPVNGFDKGWCAGIIAWDDNTGSLTDFPALPISFATIFPVSDGDDEQWTTSSGTDSFALVDELVPHDDDTTYLEDTVSTNRTLFNFTTLSSNFTGVHGIQINTVARETDASDFTLINTFKQNSTLYPESSQAIAGQTYESLFNVLDQDPDTSTAWTVSGVNSLQAGIEVG